MKLRPKDQEYLDRKDWTYEVTVEKDKIYVVVKDMLFSSKYTPRKADLMFMILPGYPTVKLDMFWTRPDVLLASNNKKPPSTESIEQHLGMSWQRWSRHLEEWRPGIDGFETFFAPILKEIQNDD